MQDGSLEKARGWGAEFSWRDGLIAIGTFHLLEEENSGHLCGWVSVTAGEKITLLCNDFYFLSEI